MIIRLAIIVFFVGFTIISLYLAVLSLFQMADSSDSMSSRFFSGNFVGLIISFFIFFIFRPSLGKLIERGNAMRQVDAISLLEKDTRPPILYLRSFDDDELVDTTRSSAVIPLTNTYEVRINQALANIGPMISIGRPGEALPKIGSARFYVSDEEWQTAIEYFLNRAVAVVIMMGSTKGVLWEIERAIQYTNPERLLIFFPYVFSEIGRSKRLLRYILDPGWNETIVKFGNKLPIMAQKRVDRYKLFYDQVKDTVPFTLPPSLGNASFLSFTSDGVPYLLQTIQPLPGGSLLYKQLENEINFKRTLRPFVSNLLGKAYQPDLIMRLTNRRFLWLTALLLGLLLISSPGMIACLGALNILSFQNPWLLLCIPSFFGGFILFGIAINFLRAKPAP